jgi:hypothetical protein
MKKHENPTATTDSAYRAGPEILRGATISSLMSPTFLKKDSVPFAMSIRSDNLLDQFRIASQRQTKRKNAEGQPSAFSQCGADIKLDDIMRPNRSP